MIAAETGLQDNLQTLWDGVLDVIQQNTTQQTYSTWFAPTKLISDDEKTLRVNVPNNFFAEWLESHYSKLISNAVLQFVGEHRRIRFIPRDSKPATSAYHPLDWKSEPAISQKPLHTDALYSTRINERYTFENFIVGDSNNFAYAASRAVSESPGETKYNPLIIYGGTGLGKTHLIQAIGNYSARKKPGTRVFYASSETFTTHFINSIQENKASEFSAFYRSCDILLLDDIQFFAKKGKTQEEFFHTFNDLQQNKKQIVLTSDRPINELNGLEERLLSRFNSGLVVDVQPPDFETRLAILRNKCDESGLEIPGDVLEYLAVNLTANVRVLEGALTKIMAQVTFTSAEPTVDLARSIVTEITPPDKNNLSIDSIMTYVAKSFQLPIDQLRAKTRKREIVKARQVAMYLAKKLTNHSLITIGLHFGGRDHTTVIHALDNVAERLKEDPVFAQKIQGMEKHLEYNR